MPALFLPAVVAPAEDPGEAWWFVFQGDKLLVKLGEATATIPRASKPVEATLDPQSRHYLGTLDGVACFAAGAEEAPELSEGMSFVGLRRLYGLLDEALFWLAGRAVQVVEWDRTHRFCGRCGHATTTKGDERAKECPQCGLISYPRLAPAIIVAVERDGRILLGRSQRNPAGFYSVLAGFVEAGETLEDAVVREIREEVGIEVVGIRYFGSQPWPFPHSLMIAFTAVYAAGEVTLDGSEIEEAGWYAPDSLPNIPTPISISRRLIDDFVARQRREQ